MVYTTPYVALLTPQDTRAARPTGVARHPGGLRSPLHGSATWPIDTGNIVSLCKTVRCSHGVGLTCA